MAFKVSENLSDQVATYLSEKIIRLKLEPGERILEQKIADELGISRSPIREAIRILEKSGLVEIIPRCGARVTRVPEEFISGFCDVLSVLCGLVVRRLIENCQENHLQELIEIHARMVDSAERGDDSAFYEGIFHYASVSLESAGNQILTRFIHDLMPNSRRLQSISIKMKTNDLKRNIEYFKIILDSIESGDVARGEKAIQEYVEAEKEFVLSAIKSSEFSHYINEI